MVLPILLTEIREEGEDPDRSLRITELKFDFSSKRKTVTDLGIIFFPPMIICFSFFKIALFFLFHESRFLLQDSEVFILGFVTEDILWPPLFSLPPKCRLPS